MKFLLTILFSFLILTASSQVLIGYVKDGGSFSNGVSGCTQTNINTAIYSNTRQVGQTAVGDILYTNVGGTVPLNGGFTYWAFTTTNGGSNPSRELKIDATGHILQMAACGDLLSVAFKSTTATSSCANTNFTDSIYGFREDPSMYDGKYIAGTNGGSFVSNGNYTASNSRNGIPFWTFSVVGGCTCVSSLACCTTVPIVNAGADQNVFLPTIVNLSGSAVSCNSTPSTYTWSLVSGPNSPSFGSPLLPATTVSSLIAGTYNFRLTVTDLLGASSSDVVQVIVNPPPRCTTPYRINIKDSVIWINTGAYIKPLDELFDGPEDPLNGINGTPTTGGNATLPVPRTGEKFSDYYDKVKGWVYDLWLPQQFYIYQVSIFFHAEGSDTVKVYMGDSIFNDHPNSFTRLRNLNSQVATITAYNSPGVYAWANFRVDDSTSHVRFQIKNAWIGATPRSDDGGVSNIVLYGCRIGAVPPIFNLKKKQITLKQKNGTNIATQINPKFTHFTKQKAIRTYPETSWFDDENVLYPSNRYNPAFFGGDGGHAYNDSVKNAMGIFFWPSFKGAPQWLASTYGLSTGYAKLDSPTVNQEDPASFERAADMFWNLVKIYCPSCTVPADTPYMRQHNYSALNGGRKVYNRNEWSAVEDDNERNGWFQAKRLTPIGAVAQASAVKDGDQNRLHDQWGGNRMGIKNADPNMPFIMSGTVGMDVEEIKARIYLSIMLRGEVMWDIIQGHQYWSRFDDPLATATTAGQVGNWGTYPEDDSARYQYDRVVFEGNRIAKDTLAYMTGEHGSDEPQYYPHDQTEVTANRTQYGSPKYIELGSDVLDSTITQAIAIEQGFISSWRSNLVYAIQYLYHDLTPRTDLPGYLNSYIGSGYVTHGLVKKPSWYRMVSQINIAGDYILNETLSEVNGGLIQYHGYLESDPHWKVDVYYMAALNTGTGIPVDINVNTATSVMEYTASNTSETGTGTPKTIIANHVASLATITPRYLISYQPDITPPPTEGGILIRKKVIVNN